MQPLGEPCLASSSFWWFSGTLALFGRIASISVSIEALCAPFVCVCHLFHLPSDRQRPEPKLFDYL
jgi:hypothetical protein